jgi:hypothetical protein
MSAAAAVVLRSGKASPIVVIKDYMLTLVTNYVADAVQVLLVLGDEKSSRCERDDHSGSISVAALIVHGTSILSGPDGYIR